MDRLKRFIDDPGERIGKYELVREVGRGGTAVVYEAYDPDLKRAVALKVLKDVGHVERLRREASVAARLRHPHIVSVHEVGPDYIAMDFVAGRTLADLLPETDLRRRIELLETVARAVGFAHEQGVVHRDLKPGNVIVEPSGRPVLTDFGLAKITGGEDLTQTGSVIGTPHYMAPEQVRGEVRATGPATDVWALGVLLYEMIADRKPFDGATALQIYDLITRQDPAPLPGEPGAIAGKALEKDPAKRYANATELAEDLRRHLHGEAISARPPGGAAQLWKRVRKNPSPYVLGTTAALLLIVVLLWRSEREAALEHVREQARVSLEAALALRRAGDNAGMRNFLPPLQSAYRQAPELPEVEYLMGRMHRALLDDATALEHQERALRRDPTYAPALYERVILLSNRHARESRKTSDESAPDLTALTESILADCRRLPGDPVAQGMAAFYEGNFDEARRLLEKTVRDDPLLEEAWDLLARTAEAQLRPSARELERQWLEAEQSYTLALERDKGYLPHLFGRSQVYLKRAEYAKERGRDAMPDFARAEADLTRVLEIDSGNVEALFRRGRVRNQRAVTRIQLEVDPLEDCKDAIKDLSQALELNPDHASARVWRGNTCYHRGYWLLTRGKDPLADFEAAEKDLSAVDNTDALRRRGRLRGHRAVWLRKIGRDADEEFDRADSDFAEAARRGSNDQWLWTWRGIARLNRGDLDGAEEFFSNAIEGHPNHAEAWENRAIARYRRAELKSGRSAQKDYALAAEDFLQTVTLNPARNPRIRPMMERAQKKAAEPER